ncbi:MAG: YraN family protein [Alistipes sp.]|jgi:putative endonuclease|nr:YraN family protein [Alistipes sp.]
MVDKQARGAEGEAFTVDWLRSNGFYIVERNWRYGHYEVDIIATRRGVVHFVEVKTRALGSIESAYLAIDTTKRTALLRAMRAYTYAGRYGCEFQVDLAAVEAAMDGSFIMHYNENILG